MASLNVLPNKIEPLVLALYAMESGNFFTFYFVKSLLLQEEQRTMFSGKNYFKMTRLPFLKSEAVTVRIMGALLMKQKTLPIVEISLGDLEIPRMDFWVRTSKNAVLHHGMD